MEDLVRFRMTTDILRGLKYSVKSSMKYLFIIHIQYLFIILKSESN